MCLQGRHLLKNDRDMPNTPGPKQAWQTECEIISEFILGSRSNPNIDYTGETDLTCHVSVEVSAVAWLHDAACKLSVLPIMHSLRIMPYSI